MVEFARQNYLPVWKVFGGSKTLWFARFEAVREAEIKKVHRLEAKRKAKDL